MRPVQVDPDPSPVSSPDGGIDADASSGPVPRVPRGVLAAAVLGAVWRFGVLVLDKWHQPLLLNDSLYYSAQAQQLWDGRWFREIFTDRPGAEHGPLTSVLLATVSWVDQPVPWQRLVTVLCGIATIVVVGLVGRRVGGDRVGTVAAFAVAVSPNFWMNDGLVMSESVSMLCVSLALLVTLGLVDRPTWRRGAVVGVALGLSALARSELALLVPLVAALVLVRERPRRSGRPWREVVLVPAIVAGLAGATVAPWVVFNLVRFERPVTLTTNDGTTLLGSYCDTTFHGTELGGWSIFCVTDDPDYAMDEEPSVRSARQRDLAVDYARDHVRRLPVVVAARVARTLDLYGLDSLVAQDTGEERYRWASWAGIVTWWVTAPLAVLGAVRLLRRAGGRRMLAVLCCPVVAVAFTTVVFYGAHRIRSSMEPSAAVLAALGSVWLLSLRATRSARTR
ncbi:MAG: glycosyltransferase family 39 protein [Acidimicrobiales bacterium]